MLHLLKIENNNINIILTQQEGSKINWIIIRTAQCTWLPKSENIIVEDYLKIHHWISSKSLLLQINIQQDKKKKRKKISSTAYGFIQRWILILDKNLIFKINYFKSLLLLWRINVDNLNPKVIIMGRRWQEGLQVQWSE